MKLSDQALGAIMMALQNALMNQADVVPVLKGFDLMIDDKEEIIVLNPPTIDTSDMLNENNNTVGSD
jgi:methylase of polypeptide subunit release factors|tara:strand:- start:1865 stop:2065 length:201 start_codon:yes stop_codon:yes gene_type:complete